MSRGRLILAASCAGQSHTPAAGARRSGLPFEPRRWARRARPWAPLVRKRYRIPHAATAAAVASAPLALAVLRPRTKKRDVAMFVLQMWAFTVLHELPYDDPDRLRERLSIRYPIRADRALGCGELPTHRLQRTFSRSGPVGARDVFLTIVHWAWFLEPHAALVWS